MLEQYRMQIDIIDEEILRLLSERFSIVEQIWIYKKENNMEIVQNSRWKELLEKRVNLWVSYNLSEEFIIQVWEEIHKEAIKKETAK